MSRINNPFDQIDEQYPADEGQALATSINLAAPLMTALVTCIATTPVGAASGALASLLAFGSAFRATSRQDARAEAFVDGLRDGLQDVERQLKLIESKVSGPDAEEAVVEAIRGAFNSGRLDKARTFGRILGGVLEQDAPNWQEAAEFIRSVEDFTATDVEALKILWNVQRTAYRVIAPNASSGRREMSTDANDFNQNWKEVLEQAEKQGVSKDDWYSRCGRLSGFGLCVMVQSNPSYQGSDAMCYRLTGRAVRLLGLLGRDVDPGHYPRIRYHPKLAPAGRRVENEDENRALGSGWFDTPNAFPRS